MIANAGMYSFCKVMGAVTKGWVRDGVIVFAKYTNENDWHVSTILYGMAHTASVSGGGVEVHLDGGLVGGFADEDDIGAWLAGERL